VRKPLIVWSFILLGLVALRLPSLVEPAGADQSLYAYVGQRINAGDVPYRDAWDQKPPAIHFIYAALWQIWPHESVVAAADLVAAVFVAALLVVLGRRTLGAEVGAVAASLFLLLGNPAIQRLSGVRVRAQCETFIAVTVTAGLVLAACRHRSASRLMLAGVFAGIAFWLKYNAGVYLLPILAMAWSREMAAPDSQDASAARRLLRSAGPIIMGFAFVSVVFLLYFGSHGALVDLGLATISYNLQYAGETYEGARGAAGYLLFPIERARVELIWFAGGVGVLALLPRFRDHVSWITVVWLAAACISVAVNGARNLPQYFVQAHPALAFCAAAGLWPVLRHARIPARAVVLVLLAAGLWKVGDEPDLIRLGGLPEAVRNAQFDLAYARGRMDRASYLRRFQQQAETKYVPLAAEELTERVRRTTAPDDRILVFGLAASVYLNAPRQSASRFFWSRPVVVEFGEGRRGYGSAGLLADLQRSAPALVALQKHWDEPGPEEFFLRTPALRRWLDAGYVMEDDSQEFSVWRRRH
jgi:hypothetical protein